MARMIMPAKLENLEKLQNFIYEFAANHLSPERTQQVQLATEEALVNIFNYAYPEDIDGKLTVICSVDDNNNLCIKFEDNGRAFDMLSIEDPDTGLSIDERPIGGLGILLIRKMVDNVDYYRKDNKNILTLIIHPEGGI